MAPCFGVPHAGHFMSPPPTLGKPSTAIDKVSPRSAEDGDKQVQRHRAEYDEAHYASFQSDMLMFFPLLPASVTLFVRCFSCSIAS
jgi:hypothetical protein